MRADKGGENVKVCEYMLHHPLRGPGASSPSITKELRGYGETPAYRLCIVHSILLSFGPD